MARKERPVLTGLIALVAVAAVVGALLGFAALFGSRVVGLGGDQTTAGDPTGGDSLYLPAPEETGSGKGSLTAPGESARVDGSGAPGNTKKPKHEISLSAGQTSVASFEKIDLTGVYSQGEGAILQVQRKEGGAWADFPVTMSVGGGTFSTYVQTSHSGTNLFRVIDTDTQATSNAVKVEVG